MHRGILLYLFVTITICNGTVLHAQTLSTKSHRILILLDGSKQMADPLPDGRTYFTSASDFISQLIENTYTVNPDVEFGLRVYGHQYSPSNNNCDDSRMEVRFSKDNLAQMSLRMHDIKPRGLSNPHYALQQSFAHEMTDTQSYWYSIIWVARSDEGKCYIDPCLAIDKTPINDLYKLYNIQLSTINQKTAGCFEQTFQLSNTADAANAFATIVPNYKKDKKPEPYWGSFRKPKVMEEYIHTKRDPEPEMVQDKRTPVINTIPPKAAATVNTAKKEIEQPGRINTIPSFTPPVFEPKRNDSVSRLNTLAIRSNTLKSFTLARVKAGTISIPDFAPPTPELAKDSVVLLTTLKTKGPTLNRQPASIITIKAAIPGFTPPVPAPLRDTIALMKTIAARSTSLKPPSLNATVAHKKAVPVFKAPVLQEPRDSVTAMTSAGAKTQLRTVAPSPSIQPKEVAVPGYIPPRLPEEVPAIAARPKPISAPLTPIAKTPKKAAVPEFYAIPLPQEAPPPTEQPPEPVTEEIVDADAVPSIIHGNLNIKTFGGTVRVQIFRIKLGEDILVSDNSFSGPRQLKIKLEPGRYKMVFNLNDGTEVTKPFLIDEETDTDISLK